MTDQRLIELLRRMSPRLDMLDCENVLTAADRIEGLVRQRDGWEETALMYAQNVDFWKSKLSKAMEALRKMADGSSDNSEAAAKRVLAELENEQ
jgi:hypothetical protein